MTSINSGVGLGLEYADTIAAIFRGKEFGSVLCFAPFVGTQQRTLYKGGQYWDTPLYCSFQYDQNFTIT
jgi:hypothetical protein